MADSVAAMLGAMTLQGLDCILHLGAGRGTALDTALSTGARHLALIEPEPGLFAALMRRAPPDPRLHLHPVAVGPRDGAALLHVLNLPTHSSLRPPRDILTLHPGLHCTAMARVAVLTLDALTRRLPPPCDNRHDLLIVECAGEEGAVIDALLAAGPDPDGPARFDRLILCCGATGTHEGSTAFDVLRQGLHAAGWVGDTVDSSDPDRPCMALQRERSPPVQAPVLAPVQAPGSAPDPGALIAELTAARDAAQGRATLARQEATAAQDRLSILQADLTELQQLLAGERQRATQLESVLRECLPHLRAALGPRTQAPRAVKPA